MMKSKIKLACAAFCAVFMFTAQTPFVHALGRAEPGQNMGITYYFDEHPTIDKVSHEEQLSIPLGFSNYEIKETVQLCSQSQMGARVSQVITAPEDFDDMSFSVSNSWRVLQSTSRADYSSRGHMTRVSLALSSNSSRNISISATASSNGIIKRMGVTTLKLQRYYKGNWTTVYSVSNAYCYRISRFIFTNTRHNLVPGAYYRLTATFLGDTGSELTTVTRVSGTIKCK